MASIQRRDGKWRAQVRRRGFPTRSATFETKAAAQRWARRVESEVESGRAAGQGLEPDITLGDLIDQYERASRASRPFGRSKEAVMRTLRRDLGSVKLSQVTPARVRAYALGRQQQGAGPVTIGVDLAFLATALRAGRALGLGGPGPQPVMEAREGLRYVGSVSRSRERERRPTPRELERLFAYWRERPPVQLPMEDLVSFAVASGMRLSEITGLLWADLDEGTKTIIIRDRKDPRRKSGNDQIVPLLDLAGWDALGLISARPRDGERIWPYLPQSIGTGFRRACIACKIEDLHFHDLRRECASRLFEAGLGVEQVALVTGHKEWRTLRRYTRLKPADLVRLRRDA